MDGTPSTHSDDPVNLLMKERASVREATMALLPKIEANILKSPDEPKFRRINVTKILKKLQGEAILALLAKAGFLYTPDGAFLELPPEADLEVMKTVLRSVRDRMQTDQQKEASERDALIKAEREKQAKERAKEKEKRDLLKKRMSAARKERAEAPKPKSSVAQQRKFGRTEVEVKFSTAGPAKGGSWQWINDAVVAQQRKFGRTDVEVKFSTAGPAKGGG